MEGGSRGTYRGAGAASIRRGRLSATLGADLLNTDGFVTLRADQAGPIDRREATTSRALLGKATWDATDALQAVKDRAAEAASTLKHEGQVEAEHLKEHAVEAKDTVQEHRQQ